MTALEIYREDRSRRKNGGCRWGRQEYYTLLRDTLHDELLREGRSDFLEQMIAECDGGKAVSLLEFAALRECAAMIVDGLPMQDASEYVPHILRSGSRPLAWRDLEKGAAFRVDDPELPQILRRLRSVSRQMVEMRDQTLAPDADRASQREIDGLRALNRALEKDNAALRTERDELRARIAQLEEGFISQQLQHRLEARRHQAERELAQELEQKRQAQEESLRKHLLAAAQREQQKRDTADMLTAEHFKERTAEYDRLHRCMQTELQTMQARLDEQLKGWQEQLHGADHRFLAQSCAALFGAVSRSTTQIMADAQAFGADERLVASLAALRASLHAQLHQLEQAMQLLGLEVYHPLPGERFDPALHSPVSAHAEDTLPSAREIEAIESPGVRLVGSDGQSRVLVRAVVRTGRRDAN